MNFKSINSDAFTIVQNDTLLYITCDEFSKHNIPHAFTTRHGGVSLDEYSSLNLAFSVDRNDSKANIDRNYEIILKAFGYKNKEAVLANQLHTDNIAKVTDLERGIGFVKPSFETGVDGLVSNLKSTLLFVRMADCLPILLCDPKKRIVSAVHSGWRGTFSGIGAKAVKMMCKEYNSDIEDIIVAFGPSIGNCCYEVGTEFRDNFISKYGISLNNCFELRNEKLFADMRCINATMLYQAGIKPENLSVYKPCTCCNPEYFFSYRRQKNKRGTLAALISADF